MYINRRLLRTGKLRQKARALQIALKSYSKLASNGVGEACGKQRIEVRRMRQVSAIPHTTLSHALVLQSPVPAGSIYYAMNVISNSRLYWATDFTRRLFYLRQINFHPVSPLPREGAGCPPRSASLGYNCYLTGRGLGASELV